MAIKWQGELANGLNVFSERQEQALGIYADTAARMLQDHMKSTAPWTDQTGEARRRLSAKSEKVENGYQITLAHGVDYGINLELDHEKRYAVIQPTILEKSNEVMQGFEGLLNRFKG